MRINSIAEFPASVKAKQCALLHPVTRQPCGQPHQFFCTELLRLPPVDDCHGDVGREPGEAQESIDVGGGHALLAYDVMHAEFGVLSEPRQNVVGSGNDPQQAWVSCGLVIVSSDKQFYFAADAAKPGACRQGVNVVGRGGCLIVPHGQVDRLPGEESGEVVPPNVDLGAIVLNVDAPDQCGHDRSGFLKCFGADLVGDLASSLKQVLWRSAAGGVMAHCFETLCWVGKEGTDSLDHNRLEVAGRDPVTT
jgi:hypothetical protein